MDEIEFEQILYDALMSSDDIGYFKKLNSFESLEINALTRGLVCRMISGSQFIIDIRKVE